MTRPGSPAAWASTASMTGPIRSRPGIDAASTPGLPTALRVRQLARDVALGIAVGDVATVVVELLAAGQPSSILARPRSLM